MTFEERLNLLRKVNVYICNCSNPYAWYNDKVGQVFKCVYFKDWGTWIVLDRLGKHTDDMTIREKDGIIVLQEAK